MPSPLCPTRQELTAYGLGRLPDERSEEIDGHLHECPDCREALATSSGVRDTLLSSLKRAPGAEEYVDEPECRKAMAVVEAIGREPSFATRQALDRPATELPELGQVGPYRFLAKLGEGAWGPSTKRCTRS